MTMGLSHFEWRRFRVVRRLLDLLPLAFLLVVSFGCGGGGNGTGGSSGTPSGGSGNGGSGSGAGLGDASLGSGASGGGSSSGGSGASADDGSAVPGDDSSLAADMAAPEGGAPDGPLAPPVSRVRTVVSFDAGWLFFKADAPGADQPAFADTAWTSLSVPHDWAIEGPFVASNPSAANGGFAPAGIGWYRKHFPLPAGTPANARVFVEFDGVMANSDVYINGFHLGHRPYGYVSFRYELTGHTAAANVLSVKVDNSAQPASRWYSGAGIYRHVRLIVTDPVHVDQWATAVTTPTITTAMATVHLQTSIVNQGSAAQSVTVQATIIDPGGTKLPPVASAAQSIAPSMSANFAVDVPVSNPRLWGVDSPNMYQVVVSVQTGGVAVDDDLTSFGIRTATFDADKGFLLNGVSLKIKGVAMHHDGSALGAAVPLRAWQRRAARLKALGANAIRTSHNPIAPELLDLYDRMGLLVMSEFFDAWNGTKQPADYGKYFGTWGTVDLTDTLKRDRNHPSIVLYSIGNEIRDPLASLVQTAKTLVGICHMIDPTRPVTQALFRPAQGAEYPGNMLDVLDVFGANYRPAELLTANKIVTPHHPIIETESFKTAADWTGVRDNAPFSGYFLWTGVDYLGESITPYPDIAKIRGLLDRVGSPYASGYENGMWWSTKPFVHVSALGGGATVYSNCDSVDLLVNGASQGVKTWDKISTRVWPGVSGTLKAVCASTPQVFDQRVTASGAAAKVVLTADHTSLTTDWNDVSYVKATISDANGAPMIGATNPVTFSITGPGTIVGVDSASLAAEPFRGTQRRAFGGDELFAPTRDGECFALVQATGAGAITVSASSAGLANSSVTVQAAAGPFVPCSGTCD